MQFENRWSQLVSQLGRGNRSQVASQRARASLHDTLQLLPSSLTSDELAGGSELPVALAQAATAIRQIENAVILIGSPPGRDCQSAR
jgi:hypothetical protein